MSKFAAQSIQAFYTPEAIAGRVARSALTVVHVEVDDGSWCELDADDIFHAKLLADTWVEKMNARGASCRRADAAGKLARSPFYKTFAAGVEPDYDAD